MWRKRGEVATLLTIGAFLVLTISTVVSSFIAQHKTPGTGTRAQSAQCDNQAGYVDDSTCGGACGGSTACQASIEFLGCYSCQDVSQPQPQAQAPQGPNCPAGYVPDSSCGGACGGITSCAQNAQVPGCWGCEYTFNYCSQNPSDPGCNNGSPRANPPAQTQPQTQTQPQSQTPPSNGQLPACPTSQGAQCVTYGYLTLDPNDGGCPAGTTGASAAQYSCSATSYCCVVDASTQTQPQAQQPSTPTQPTNTSSDCRDNPVEPFNASYTWKADCNAQCHANTDCATNSSLPGIDPAVTNWCYGFHGPANSWDDWRCLKLEANTGASSQPTAQTETQQQPTTQNTPATQPTAQTQPAPQASTPAVGGACEYPEVDPTSNSQTLCNATHGNWSADSNNNNFCVKCYTGQIKTDNSCGYVSGASVQVDCNTHQPIQAPVAQAPVQTQPQTQQPTTQTQTTTQTRPQAQTQPQAQPQQPQQQPTTQQAPAALLCDNGLTDGVNKCFGSILESCSINGFSSSKTCDYGCNTTLNQCNLPPTVLDCTVQKTTVSNGTGNCVNGQYWYCEDGHASLQTNVSCITPPPSQPFLPEQQVSPVVAQPKPSEPPTTADIVCQGINVGSVCGADGKTRFNCAFGKGQQISSCGSGQTCEKDSKLGVPEANCVDNNSCQVTVGADKTTCINGITYTCKWNLFGGYQLEYGGKKTSCSVSSAPQAPAQPQQPAAPAPQSAPQAAPTETPLEGPPYVPPPEPSAPDLCGAGGPGDCNGVAITNNLLDTLVVKGLLINNALVPVNNTLQNSKSYVYNFKSQCENKSSVTISAIFEDAGVLTQTPLRTYSCAGASNALVISK